MYSYGPIENVLLLHLLAGLLGCRCMGRCVTHAGSQMKEQRGQQLPWLEESSKVPDRRPTQCCPLQPWVNLPPGPGPIVHNGQNTEAAYVSTDE